MGRRSLTLALFFSLLASAAGAATDFILDDQFRKAHTRADIFDGRPVIMLAGMERKTPDAMEGWERALRAEDLSGVHLLGLSNLDKVPFFVRKSSIYKTLAKQFPKTVVLCDWDGGVYEELGFPQDATVAVAVFDADGRRLGLVDRAVSDAAMVEVLALLPDRRP